MLPAARMPARERNVGVPDKDAPKGGARKIHWKEKWNIACKAIGHPPRHSLRRGCQVYVQKPYSIAADKGVFPMFAEAPLESALNIVTANYDFRHGTDEHYDALKNYELDPRKRLRLKVGRPAKPKRKKKHSPKLYMYAMGRGLNSRTESHQKKKRLHKKLWKTQHRKRMRSDGVTEHATHPPTAEGFEASFSLNGVSTHSVLHDSGCSHHCVDEKSPLYALVQNPKPTKGHYLCGGGGKVQVLYTGTLFVGGYPRGKMKVKVTSGMGRGVFSATQAACDGLGFNLSRNKKSKKLNAYMYTAEGSKLALREECFGGLLYFDVSVKDGKAKMTSPTCDKVFLAKDCTKRTSKTLRSLIWKNRLAQEGDDRIRLLMKQGHKGIQYQRLNRKCAVDNYSNQTIGGPKSNLTSVHLKNEFEKEKPKPHTHYVMDLVVSTVTSVRGYKYCLTVVELRHRIKYSIMLKKKKHTFKACEELFEHLVGKHGVKPVWVRPDRGGEFMSKQMIKLFRNKYGAKYSPAQTEKPWMNGIAEHSEKDSQKRARAMLINAGLPKEYWCYAMEHAGYLSNHLPHQKLGGLTPNHSMTGKLFDYSHLRVFGCPAFVTVRKKMRDSKWGYRAKEGIYMGYKTDHETHLVRFPDGKHVDCTDMEFNELFDETYLPRGLKTTKNSYLNRKEDGSPSLTHTATGNPFLAPEQQEIETGENEARGDTGQYEIVLKKRKLNMKRPLSPVPVESDDEPESDAEDENVLPEGTFGSESETPSEKTPSETSDSGGVMPSEPATPQRTRSGRARKPKQTFEVEHRTHAEEKREQQQRTIALNEEWKKRKETDHQFRDEGKPPEDSGSDSDNEHAEFCKANYYYKMLHDSSTSSTIEFMHSASTRPTQATPGSMEERVLQVKDPKSQKQIRAMDDWNRKRFNEATDAEKKQFFDDPKVAKRVRITDVPSDAVLLNTMCVWITKFQQGKYSKTKARIVVRGDQAPKTDESTFAPTVRFTSMLTLFCLAAMYGWRVDKIDYPGAFLNADLPAPIYARFPHGLTEYDDDGTELVIKFYKAAYGISTAPRLWNEAQDAEYRDLGYHQHRTDSCVYSQSYSTETKKPSKTMKAIFGSKVQDTANEFNPNDFGILGNHVDDGAFFTPNSKVAEREKKRFFRKFPGTDEGLLKDFCGIRVDQHSKGIDLDQEAYIDALAEEYGCVNCKAVNSPIEQKVCLLDCPEVENVDRKVQKKLWKLNGQLMYLCTHTRPDLSYAMNQLTSVAHRPAELHLAQAHHLLRYVVTTKKMKMKFHRATKMELTGYNYMDPSAFDVKADTAMEGYCDSSYGDCKVTAKSSAGHVFFLGKNQACVEAIAKKLPVVGNSSTENEYITLSRAAQSGFYIKQFLDELGIYPKPVRFKMYEDNSATLNALKKNVATSKFRQLRTRWHYLRDMVRDKEVCVQKIGTDFQIADIFTKPLFGDKLRKFTAQMLGHQSRDHKEGEIVDMDYQPEMEKITQNTHMKPSYLKILKSLPP